MELQGDYEGWWADVDLDIDLGTLEDLGSGQVPRIVDAFGRMVLEWNFVDKRGDPLPSTPEGCRRIGKSLLAAFMEGFNQATRLPNE